MESVTSPSAAPRSSLSRALLAFGPFFFKYRDFVFPVVFFGLVLSSRPLPSSPRLGALLDALGIAVALAGQALRAAVIGFAYIRRGGKDKKIYADGLVQEGLFAHSRNPLYLGNFLALVGFCLIYNSALCYLIGIPFFAFAYLSIVTAEEDFLSRKFGAAYESYRRRVNRFLPSLSGLRGTLSGMDFDWRRVLRKEYGSTFAGLFCVMALLTWEEYLRGGDAGAREMLRADAAFAVLAVPAYLALIYLKKTGALGRD